LAFLEKSSFEKLFFPFWLFFFGFSFLAFLRRLRLFFPFRLYILPWSSFLVKGMQGMQGAIMKQVKCACCKILFTPRPNNLKTQKYCSAPACQRERNRIKNQTWRKRQGLAFRLSEADRQRRIRERRKEQGGTAAAPPAHPPGGETAGCDALAQHDALLGMAALITGSDSPPEVHASLARLAEKGRMLRSGHWHGRRAVENST
jgi:hypothetical protein